MKLYMSSTLVITGKIIIYFYNECATHWYLLKVYLMLLFKRHGYGNSILNVKNSVRSSSYVHFFVEC